jgi:hypothetical protein
MYGVTVVRASDDMIAVFNLMPGYWGGKVPASLDAPATAPPTPTAALALTAKTVRLKPMRRMRNASHPMAMIKASGQNKISTIAQSRKMIIASPSACTDPASRESSAYGVSKPTPVGIADPVGVATLASADLLLSSADSDLRLAVTAALETKCGLPDLALLPWTQLHAAVLLLVPGLTGGGCHWLRCAHSDTPRVRTQDRRLVHIWLVLTDTDDMNDRHARFAHIRDGNDLALIKLKPTRDEALLEVLVGKRYLCSFH